MAYNQLLIAHIMSKIIFTKYLPPVRPKMVPKLKMLRIYWNLAHIMFQVCWSCQIYFWNIYHLSGPNWSQNWKCTGFIKIWHIWYFKYPDLDFDVKNIFINYLPIVKPQTGSKIKSTQNLLKFSTYNISNVPISILMSKMVFYQIFTNC